MTQSPPSENLPHHDDLPAPYRRAVQAILDEPMPSIDVAQRFLLSVQKSETRTTRRRWLSRVGAWTTAGAAAVLIGVLIQSERSLYAQVLNAIREAHTFQLSATYPENITKPERFFQGLWYVRDVGFREESSTDILISNPQGTWRHQKGTQLAIQARGEDLDVLIDRALLIDAQFLKDAKHERLAERDQIIDGQACQAHVVTSPVLERMHESERQSEKGPTGKRREILLLDSKSRIARVIWEVQTNKQWTSLGTTDFKFDQPIDPAKFEPRFGDDVRVVDVDSAFDEFASLSKAVHQEERSGLIYAVHRAERLDNGGVYLVTSVRGTDATNHKYPFMKRHWANGVTLVDGPAYTYPSSQQHLNCITVDLAEMNQQGVHVCWWVILPFEGSEFPFNAGPGKVKISASVQPQGEFGKANFTDNGGVTHGLKWDVEIDIEEPKSLPSLDAISMRVYADLKTLEFVPYKSLNDRLRGTKFARLTDLNKTSSADFVAAVADDVQWWKSGNPMDDPRRLELSTPPKPKK